LLTNQKYHSEVEILAAERDRQGTKTLTVAKEINTNTLSNHENVK